MRIGMAPRLNTNCKWAEIMLLNGIRGLRLLNHIEQPGVYFVCSNWVLQCQGNDREIEVLAWFEAEFTDGGLPKIGVQCGNWNETIAGFRWPGQNEDFHQCVAGPGNIFNPQPYQECSIYITESGVTLDALSRGGKPVRGKAPSKDDGGGSRA